LRTPPFGFSLSSAAIVRQPFTTENALTMLNLLGDMATMLMIYVLASVIGRRLLSSTPFIMSLEKLVFRSEDEYDSKPEIDCY
jgi:hypothetical protein